MTFFSDKRVIIALIFTFTILLRVWNFADSGETWDETAYILDGHKLVKLISRLDFQNKDWYSYPDHPPVAKYLYGVTSYLDQDGTFINGSPSFKFDYNFSRLLSVLYGALAASLLTLFGWRFFSKKVGILSGLILSLLPVYVGLSQLVTLESPIVLFFIASIYLFSDLLEKPRNKKIFLTGVVLGLTLGIKLTNFLIIPIFIFALIAFHLQNKSRLSGNQIAKILLIFPLSILVFYLLWPALWFHAPETIKNMISLRNSNPNTTLLPLFMGKFENPPIYYYAVYFFITTPLLIIAALFSGLKDIFKKPTWIYLAVIVWFFVPFTLSFYHLKQGGIRYIIEIYPALAILAAIGITYFAKRFKEYGGQLLYIVIPLYLLISCFIISPYYLDYFNSLAGGSAGVYQNHTFPLGDWGEGQREAVIFLTTHASRGSLIGVYVVPRYLLPRVDGLTYEFYQDKKTYDYLIVNYPALLDSHLDFSAVPKNYHIVYSVQAGGAPIVNVYKRIQ